MSKRDHQFSGKKVSKFVVRESDGWKALDVKTRAPRISGEETKLVYARIAIGWRPGTKSMAKVECRYVRANGDETAYDERHYEYGTVSVPFQMMHMEEGSAIGGHWEFRIHGGASSMTITTRYCKFSVIQCDEDV